MWDASDAETTAAETYRRANADDEDPPSPIALARMLGVPVRVAPRAHLWGTAKLTHIDGAPVIWVAPGQSREVRWFAVAHELAELEILRCGYRGEGIEDLANAAGAAILAPRRAFRIALGEHGDNWTALAAAFGTTESCVALRAGEVTGEPLALVSPALVRVRGDGQWPDADEVRRMSRGRCGLRKARLRDDPRRVVMRAATGLVAGAVVVGYEHPAAAGVPDYFSSPRNVGVLWTAVGGGQSQSPSRRDILKRISAGRECRAMRDKVVNEEQWTCLRARHMQIAEDVRKRSDRPCGALWMDGGFQV